MDKYFHAILPFGDNAVVLNFGDTLSHKTNRDIHNFHYALNEKPIHGFLYSIPAYTTLTVVFDKRLTNLDYFSDLLRKIQPVAINTDSPKKISIPVCYEDEYSLDMDEVCTLCNLTKEELITIHTSRIYDVYMMGFLPGFAYLGMVDERILVPRKKKPRQHVFRNAVGLAGIQTGIYPTESPGGWQIIGCAAIDVFDVHALDPFLIQNGDQIEFYSISKKEFEAIKKMRL